MKRIVGILVVIMLALLLGVGLEWSREAGVSLLGR